MKSILIKGLPLFGMASLTLGLAPFFPEPHIWEKIRWLATGQPMDLPIYWFDLAMHGTPWVLLLTSLGLRAAGSRPSETPS
jgi:hypothetical protein